MNRDSGRLKEQLFLREKSLRRPEPGRGRQAPGFQFAGAPSGARVLRPVAPVLGPSALCLSSCSFPLTVVAFPHPPSAAHIFFLFFLTDWSFPSSFTLQVLTSVLLVLLQESHSSDPVSLAGESPVFLSYPAPPPFLSPANYLAPGSSYPLTSILSSRHSRVLITPECTLFLLLLPLDWGGRREFRVELPRVLFYSFNSFTFPFLLCVTFTYLLIYPRSGSFPFISQFTVSVWGCALHTHSLAPHSRPPPPAQATLGISSVTV